jgi:hypothetical protein
MDKKVKPKGGTVAAGGEEGSVHAREASKLCRVVSVLCFKQDGGSGRTGEEAVTSPRLSEGDRQTMDSTEKEGGGGGREGPGSLFRGCTQNGAAVYHQPG